MGAGVEAGDAATYAALIAGNNVAQNSWRMTFFDEVPFLFDPDVPGHYEFYLAASDMSGEIVRTSMTVVVVSDTDVTPDAIFGSGNDNGEFTINRQSSVELGLRAKLRFPASNIFKSNGDGTYTYNTGSGTSTAPNPEWGFEWSVNTDFTGGSGLTIDDFNGIFDGEAQAKEIFHYLDTEDDGKVSFDDFRKALEECIDIGDEGQ